MSAIRPDLPAIPQPSPGAPSAARSAQAAFFQAAMGQAQPSSRTALQTVQTPVTTDPQAARPSADPMRTPRPGSLLDIRV